MGEAIIDYGLLKPNPSRPHCLDLSYLREHRLKNFERYILKKKKKEENNKPEENIKIDEKKVEKKTR